MAFSVCKGSVARLCQSYTRFQTSRIVNFSSKQSHCRNQQNWYPWKPCQAWGQQIRRGFQRQSQETQSEKSSIWQNPLTKRVAFTGLFVPCCCVGTVVWQYENLKSAFTRARRFNERQQMQKHGADPGFRDHMNMIWNGTARGKKAVIGIIAANVCVFAMWRIPSIAPVMSRFFTSIPARGNSVLSMVLSAFSHQSAVHLGVNMYVLWQFSTPVLKVLGLEHTVGLYFSAATVSCLTSCLSKTLLKGAMIPSVGASGAIMALLGVFCYKFPDSQLCIAFIGDLIPHSFSAKSAMIGIALLDLTGLVLRWRMLDHAGHLGGLLFGLLYVNCAGFIRDTVWPRYHALRQGREK